MRFIIICLDVFDLESRLTTGFRQGKRQRGHRPTHHTQKKPAASAASPTTERKTPAPTRRARNSKSPRHASSALAPPVTRHTAERKSEGVAARPRKNISARP